MTIHMLDDALINKIAAGEVIERPASAVKELVENAIDADSRNISVAIARGGHDLIAVADDGQGISEEEIALAFMRHATSKLANEQDLYAISTLGFRGEALPSIAAVARVEIRTACQEGRGQVALIEGGRWLSSVPAPFPRGTTIQIRDLFFNTPARKKFMKSAGSESGRISQLVASLALGRPDIAFEYRNEKKLFFKTPGDGSLYNAMLAVYGNDYCSHFMEIKYESESIGLEGYISRPDFKRVNRRSQVFFVNERSIESPMLARALDEGYRGRLISREYPAAVIKLRVPPDEVDVNIHPQKREVKFQDDSMIFRALQGVVKARLQSVLEEVRGAAYNFTVPADYPRDGQVNENARPRLHNQPDIQASLPLEMPRSASSSESDRPWQPAGRPGALTPAAWRQETARQAHRYLPPVRTMNREDGANPPETSFRVLSQLDRRYIVLESADGLILVDQHAAHERIMFERLRSSSSGPIEGHDLLMPLQYQLGPAQYEFVLANIERFHDLGLTIEAFGESRVLVRSLPLYLKNLDLSTLDGIIDLLQNHGEEQYRDQVLALMACKSAIKSGEALDLPAMERLIEELFALENPFTCPHGRPTIINIDIAELDRRFKRIT